MPQTTRRRRPRLEELEARVLLSGAALAGGSVRGVLFEDRDGDGMREPGEDGLAGRVVFLDSNRDGQLSPGEMQTVTERYGVFSFTGLPPGRYTVGRVLPEGWSATSQRPPVSGTVPASPAAQLIGLDRLLDDPRFANIDGRGQTVVVIDTVVDSSHPFFGPDSDGDGRGDAILAEVDFTGQGTVGTIGHGTHVTSVIASRDPLYPGVAPGASVITLNALGSDGGGDFLHVEQALQWVLDHADEYSIAAVNLSFGDGGNYDTPQDLHGIDDELAAVVARGIFVSAAAGNDHGQGDQPPGIAYPAARPGVQAVGAVWANSVGPMSWEGGARDYNTAIDRIVSFSQRVPGLGVLFAPGAMVVGAAPGGRTAADSGTSVASAMVSGAAALAQQLAREHLGRALAPDELRELLARTGEVIYDGDDESDNVTNTNAYYPRLNVFAMAEAIWEMGDRSSPVPPPALGPTFTLAPNRTAGGIAFGDFQFGRISGTVFADANGNGRLDPGEVGLAGRTVFSDTNSNGRLDPGEPSVATGTDGRYELTGLTAGEFEVRQVLDATQKQTTEPVRVLVASRTVRAGVNLGNSAVATAPELIGPGTLTSVSANDPAPRGDSVISLLGETFRDPDSGTVPGIAVLGGTGQGRWMFSLDNGRSWTDIGSVSPTRARLVSGAARVRFIPARGWSGTAVLTYRGWDGSIGRQAGWADIDAVGGRSAFSLQVRSATLRVIPPAPPVEGPAAVLTTIAALLGRVGQPAESVRGLAIESATGPGQWSYSPDGYTWRVLNNPPADRAILLPAAYRLRFVPQAGGVGFPLVTYRLWVQGGWSEQVANVLAPGIGDQRYGVELG